MYSRFEPIIAKGLVWLARIVALVVAVVILAIGFHEFLRGEKGSLEIWRAVGAVLAAMAFLSILRFELLGAVLVLVATVWIECGYILSTELPEHSLFVMLLPAFLGLGGWLRRAEYEVVSKYDDSLEAQ